jgi:hypothetical protein
VRPHGRLVFADPQWLTAFKNTSRRFAGIFANIQASSGATYCRTVTRA